MKSKINILNGFRHFEDKNKYELFCTLIEGVIAEGEIVEGEIFHKDKSIAEITRIHKNKIVKHSYILTVIFNKSSNISIPELIKLPFVYLHMAVLPPSSARL
ncbi:hypothetical protein [Ulvibacterium marinum]|uniref:hypothetical protein n=1 Tax=Ulvibacterium marinum TaxID=2419782 RepID=UPI0024959DFF|nr:hypothetical protein [Ulvibacterium marinum]